jgi:poly-beta-1,6-N-acetyl-D-glucosamine synthase
MQWLFLIILIPYIYLLLKIYNNLTKIKPFQRRFNPDIFVSVIVACHNEEKNLPQLLSDISAQVLSPYLFELIIVDDNSADSTFEIASGFNGIKNLKVIRNAGIGKKKAVRAGVEACKGELIITTDADCRLGINWLETISSFYFENKSDMVICPVDMQGGRGFFHRFQELEFLSLQGVTAGTAMAGDPVMCNGANLAFKKEIYRNHSDNLHEENVSGEDIFLLHSVKKVPGKKIMWLESADATATTSTSEIISRFLRQRARWLSKAGSYSDSYTQVLAIVTFVTISFQLSILIAGFFEPVFLLIFLASLILKSIPDFLILLNTTSRYCKRSLMRWFLPSQIIYPLYILMVTVTALLKKNRWN